jgi:NADH-quinone oxidoreductase subunit G
MPVTEGLRVLTDSDRGEGIPQVDPAALTLNHPVDCGICDKAGECTLQDYHYAYNGAPSCRATQGALDQVPRAVRAHRPRQRALHPVLALRALHARDIEVERARHTQRGDTSLVRAREDGAFDADPYSDNVVDLCPVGALALPLVPVQVPRLVPATHAVRLSRLRAGCTVDIWHRKANGSSCARPGKNVRIERVTPRENPRSTARGSATRARPRADLRAAARAAAMVKGKPIDLVRRSQSRAR